MTDDLVKQSFYDGYQEGLKCGEAKAADRIEQLEAKQQRLKSENIELKELIQSLCDYTGTTASTTWIKFDPQPKWYLKETKND